MNEFEIYAKDLKDDVLAELLEAAGVSSAKEMNWDVLPITTIYL